MNTQLKPGLKQTLKERLAIWDDLSILSLQLMALVNEYCAGSVAHSDAMKKTRCLANELAKIQHQVDCWRLQREGKN